MWRHIFFKESLASSLEFVRRNVYGKLRVKGIIAVTWHNTLRYSDSLRYTFLGFEVKQSTSVEIMESKERKANFTEEESLLLVEEYIDKERT